MPKGTPDNLTEAQKAAQGLPPYDRKTVNGIKKQQFHKSLTAEELSENDGRSTTEELFGEEVTTALANSDPAASDTALEARKPHLKKLASGADLSTKLAVLTLDETLAFGKGAAQWLNEHSNGDWAALAKMFEMLQEVLKVAGVALKIDSVTDGSKNPEVKVDSRATEEDYFKRVEKNNEVSNPNDRAGEDSVADQDNPTPGGGMSL